MAHEDSDPTGTEAHNSEPSESADGTIRSDSQDAELSSEAPESLFDPSLDARAQANHIFETKLYEGEPLRYGQLLRRVREALGLELADIARETMIRDHYLMAIERMEIGPIPQGYLTAYLRSFAGQLGLPAEEVVIGYTTECGAVEKVDEATPVPKIGEIAKEKSDLPKILAVAAALLVVVGGSAVLFSGGGSDIEVETALPAKPYNGAHDSLFADAQRDTRQVAKTLPLEIHAVKQGWLEVRGADGTIFRSRVMAKGERYFPRLDAGWTVSARDGSAFEWRVGDLVVGALSEEATPVFSVSVDQKLALAADIAAPSVAAAGQTTANP
jgi:transcriptional regulator with XRE-family HTH domain